MTNKLSLIKYTQTIELLVPRTHIRKGKYPVNKETERSRSTMQLCQRAQLPRKREHQLASFPFRGELNQRIPDNRIHRSKQHLTKLTTMLDMTLGSLSCFIQMRSRTFGALYELENSMLIHGQEVRSTTTQQISLRGTTPRSKSRQNSVHLFQRFVSHVRV